MTFANFGSLGVKPGHRAELISLLTAYHPEMADVGCLLYEVGKNDEDPHKVFVCELWESEEAHRASLELASTQELITRAMPLLTGENSGTGFFVKGSPLREE